MMQKIIAKLGLLVLVGWLVGACDTCTTGSEQAVEVEVRVEEADLFLVGGASEKANKSALPGNHKPEAGLYKTPVWLEAAPPGNPDLPPETLFITLPTIKLVPNKMYFVYSTKVAAEQDSEVARPEITFRVKGKGTLLLIKKGGETKGGFIKKDFSSMPVELRRGNALTANPKIVLKEKNKVLATLPANSAGPVPGNKKATLTYNDLKSELTLTQTGLKKDAMTDADPTPIPLRFLVHDVYKLADDKTVLHSKNVKIVVTVTKLGISANPDATPPESYADLEATRTFERKQKTVPKEESAS